MSKRKTIETRKQKTMERRWKNAKRFGLDHGKWRIGQSTSNDRARSTFIDEKLRGLRVRSDQGT